MIENILIYALILVTLYLVLTIKKERSEWTVDREKDEVIEVIAGKFMLKEK